MRDRITRLLFEIFSRVSISLRITLGSIAVLMVVAITTAIGIVAVRSTAADTSHLYDHAIIGMMGVTHIRSDALALQIVTRNATTGGLHVQASAGGKFFDNLNTADVGDSVASVGSEADVERLKLAVGSFVSAAKRVVQLAAAGNQEQAQNEFASTEQPRFKALMGLTHVLMQGLNQSARSTVFEADKTKRRFIFLTELLLASNVIAGALVGFGAFIGMAKPLHALRDTMKRMADGERDVQIPALALHDEIGAMATTLHIFQESMTEAERLRLEADESRRREEEEKTRHMADAERRRAEEDKAKDRERAEAERRSAEAENRTKHLTEMIHAFDNKVSSVLQTVTSSSSELKTTAERMGAIAEETAKQADVVDAASTRTERNVQTVTAASEQLSTAIGEIARQVALSTQVAGRAVEAADGSAERVKDLVDRVRKIDGIVDMIREIASQTNLLALNATIEAARAGSAGKGFSVVASEVKDLASQTAKATAQIAAEIGDVQSVTGSAAMAMDDIRATIGEINESTTAIASAIEEQGAATREISKSVESAATGTAEVRTNIEGVARAAQDTGAASQQVLAAATGVTDQAGMLRAEVTTFLRDVRVATAG